MAQSGTTSKFAISAKLILLLYLFCPLLLFSQRDTIARLSLANNEFGILLSAGLTSTNHYKEGRGRHYFLPYYNNSLEARLKYSKVLDNLSKFSTGVTVGVTEYEFLIAFEENSLPGTSQYFKDGYYNSGYFGFFSKSFDNLYVTIPLLYEHKIFTLWNKHELWFSGGVEIQYFLHSKVIAGGSVTLDTITYNLYSAKYKINPMDYIVPGISVGIHYNFTFKNYQQLYVGITGRYNLADQIEGEYESLAFDNSFYSKGTFKNPMHYLGLEIGYTFNDKRKNIAKNKALLKTKRISR